MAGICVCDAYVEVYRRVYKADEVRNLNTTCKVTSPIGMSGSLTVCLLAATCYLEIETLQSGLHGNETSSVPT